MNEHWSIIASVIRAILSDYGYPSEDNHKLTEAWDTVKQEHKALQIENAELKALTGSWVCSRCGCSIPVPQGEPK